MSSGNIPSNLAGGDVNVIKTTDNLEQEENPNLQQNTINDTVLSIAPGEGKNQYLY